MVLLWDVNPKTLAKTARGKGKILERMINYGPGKGRKIPLKEVKKHWNTLHLNTGAQRLMELLIWGKYRSSPKTNKRYYIS